MAEVICPDNIQIAIEPEAILDHAMKMKKQGFRLSQACAAYVNKKFELSYSFADDSGTYQLTTLRIVIDPETEVSSITELYPYAFLYENEMKELFGVKIRLINLDYDNKLYRIRQETPLKVDRPEPKKPVPPVKPAGAANAAAAKPANAAAPAAASEKAAEAVAAAKPETTAPAKPAEAAKNDDGQKGDA